MQVFLFNITSYKCFISVVEQIVCSSYRKNPLDSVLRIPEASMTQNKWAYMYHECGISREYLWVHLLKFIDDNFFHRSFT